jgi:hypothetical protein
MLGYIVSISIIIIYAIFTFYTAWLQRNHWRNREHILCAAIHFMDGKAYNHQPENIDFGFVVCGHRHHNCFMTSYILDPDRSYIKHNDEQGFITNKNRFVNREEAAKIAYYAGQTKNLKDKLFSGDLY